MADVRAFRLKPRKHREFVPKEYDEQKDVFDYAADAAKLLDPRWHLLVGSINGAVLGVRQAMTLKRAGMKNGYPDIFLPVSRISEDPNEPALSGLFIELKRLKGGVVSDEQEAWHTALRKQGFKVLVCRGAKTAIDAINDYLGPVSPVDLGLRRDRVLKLEMKLRGGE